MSSAVYDDCWTLWVGSNMPLTYTDCNLDSCVPDSNDVLSNVDMQALIANGEKGPMIGNGKIAMHVSMANIDTHANIITSDFQYAQGVFKTNTLPLFHTSHCKLYSDVSSEVQFTPLMQKLNMQFGITTTMFDVTPSNAALVPSRVESDVYVTRQFPYCTMTTLRIVPQSNVASMTFFHEPYADPSMVDVEFNNSVIYNEQARGIPVLHGRAKVAGTTEVAFASTYLFEGAYENLGFNVFRDDPKRCSNRFELHNMESNQVYKLHIVTASLSSFDFDAPLEEAKRIVLSIMGREATHALVAQNVIRKKHVGDWTALWASNISLEAKSGITSVELDEIQEVRKHIRYSLYNIYASTRSSANIASNPMNVPVIDRDSSVITQGDLWLVPLLIFLRPEIARSLLEHRYATLQMAIQLAAGYGYKGSKYPYTNDVIGYKHSLYWDTVSPQHVFNSAFIAVNVWNYYRVTLDNEWLRTTGYTILKHIADFFISLVELDETSMYYVTKSLYGFVREGDNNALTNSLIRLTLRYVLEASYELGYNVRQEWIDVYNLLKVPFHETPTYNTLNDVFKLDDAATTTETYAILEPLIILLPLYSKVFFADDPNCFNLDSVIRNLDFYEPKKSSTHPFNDGLLSTLHGIVTQSVTSDALTTTYLNKFITNFQSFTDANTAGVWGNFKSPTPSVQNQGLNDINMNALYLLMVLTGVCGVDIKGGVSETKYYYEAMEVQHYVSAKMPSTWALIQARGLAGKNLSFNVVNSITYP